MCLCSYINYTVHIVLGDLDSGKKMSRTSMSIFMSVSIPVNNAEIGGHFHVFH